MPKTWTGIIDVSAYLFVWNPKKWDWETLDQSVDQLEATGRLSEKWSCASHKAVAIGDRAFLLRLGVEPKGIMGSGWIASQAFLSPHWSGDDKLVPRVIIDFDTLLHPDKSRLLGLDLLSKGPLAQQTWTPQASGISISPDVVPALEALWFEFLASGEGRAGRLLGGDTGAQGSYSEGAQTRVEVTRYERNPHARRACIEHYGLACVVCGLNFEKRYGELGRNFIHVHHLQSIAAAGQVTIVDPVIDLRPVCPNCHSMLHRKTPPLRIEELAAQMIRDGVT